MAKKTDDELIELYARRLSEARMMWLIWLMWLY